MQVTISSETIANARADIQRLNCQLAELRLEEQRCQLKRLRWEAEHARVKAFVETCELAQRFATPAPASQHGPVVRVAPFDKNQPNGVKLVTVEAPKERQKRKPDDTPTMKEMVVTALKDAAKQGQDGLKPREMVDFVRQKWWSTVTPSAVCSTAWRMAQDGALQNDGGVYKLRGRPAVLRGSRLTGFTGGRVSLCADVVQSRIEKPQG